MSTAILTFSPFEPANEVWEAYLERFECFLQANNLSDISSARKRGYFLSFCGRHVFATARALTAPQAVSSVPWDTLLEKLQAHYSPKPSRVARRHLFRQRFQGEGESINDFMASLRDAALQCEFTDLEDMLLDQLVTGVKDLRLQRRLLARSEVTLQVAIEEARASEMSERSSAEIQRFHVGTAAAAAAVKPLSVHHEDADGDAPFPADEAVRRLNAARRNECNREGRGNPDMCLGCGRNHNHSSCRFKTAICRRCGRMGHLSRVCRALLPAPTTYSTPLEPRRDARRMPSRRDEHQPASKGYDVATIDVNHASSGIPVQKIFLRVLLEDVPISMEIDTGSSRSLIVWPTLQKLMPHISKRCLQPCQISLRDYQGRQIPTVGCGVFRVAHGSFLGKLPLIVVRDNLPSLLGLDWFAALHLEVSGVHANVLDTPDNLFSEFGDVFDGSLGKYTGRPIAFNLDPQIAPRRLKPRRVPLALRPRVDKELDKLISQGVLEPIDHSNWETPIVIPLKPDGSIRICADYKCTINRALQDNPYPVPVVQHLLHSLGQGRIFAKLDLAQAYQQLPVDEATAMAQAIVTHRGAFKCNRLQFGVSIAPGLFQGLMERLLHGNPGVVPYFDDVLISARDRSELIERLRAHKPLLGLLAGDRQTPQILSPRMSRWVEFLAAYSYQLLYKPGKSIGHADALSRCPLPITEADPAPTSAVLLVEDWDVPVSAVDIESLSAKDPFLSKIIDWVKRGWPRESLASEFLPYSRRQHELSVLKGCLLWGNRVVVPPDLRKRILSCLHDAHPGMVRMKALGRSYVWWPGMDQEIEAWVANCPQCQASRSAPAAAPVRNWENPRNPWARIHVDFAGPFLGQTFLILVDAYSKWVDIALTPSPTAGAVVRVLETLFATHGLPDVIVTDNGAQFTSAYFQQFMARLGIRHAPTAPFHPAGNGRAERAVRAAKEALSRLRRLRTTLDRLHPSFTPDIPRCTDSNYRNFRVGDLVYAENFGADTRWLPGTIIQLTGPYSYRVQLGDGRPWRRHINQLRRRIAGPADPCPEQSIAAPTPDHLFGGPVAQPDTPRTSTPEAVSPAALPAVPVAAASPGPFPDPDVHSPPSEQDGSPAPPTPAPPTQELRQSGRSRRRPAYLADYACAIRRVKGVMSSGIRPEERMPVASRR
ncbi:uncharacterized protein K02A2.6-like [Ahaetulla prasina]|uniref:uncharacterized protein K02A2.6-like n=1 Tax=Ahaetulla prasina TaxID=499056 RepID=UPI00264A0846|nr:uncharacterized protein K02A2.6-like [Ahaetulla prasina]